MSHLLSFSHCTWTKAFAVSVLACLAVSCQKYNFEDESEEGVLNEKSTVVKVRTRGSGDVQLEYPVFIYVFSQNGNLLDTQKIGSSSEQMSVRVPMGEESHIVALSADESVYEIPSSPQLSSVVTMKSVTSEDGQTASAGKGYVVSHPLQMGCADISPTSQNAAVTIQLSYQMASINAELHCMPASCPKVSIKVSKSGGGLCLNGSFTESTGVVIPLSRQEGSDETWVSDEVYIFPTMGTQTTFTIMYSGDDGEEYASVNYMALLKAGTPYKLNGTFSDGNLEVSGNILPADWGQAVSLNFGFSSSTPTEITPEGDESEDESQEETVELPSVASEWNGHLVAAVEENGDGTASVMLVSREDWGSMTSAKNESTEVFDIEDEYVEDGLGEWHIPTQDEARVLRSAYLGLTDEFDAIMEETGVTPFTLTDEKGSNIRYLCDDASMTYSMKAGNSYNSIKEAGATVKTYHLRLVKNVSLKVK